MLRTQLNGFPSERIKVALNWCGGALGLAGLIFVGYRLWHQSDELSNFVFDVPSIAAIVLMSIAYSAANVLAARAWWLLLVLMNDSAGWRAALKVYGISQLAKYAPGNIFQFVGRQALGVAVGISGKVLAKSAILEIALLITSGSIFAGLAVPLLVPASAGIDGVLIFASLYTLAAIAIYAWKGPQLVLAFSLQVLFFAVSGLVFVFVLNLVHPGSVGLSTACAVAGAFVMSWLGGFLTPGAPAGLGVREFMLTVMLGAMIIEADLLVAVILARGVTMLGDLGFYLSSVVATNAKLDRGPSAFR